MESRSQAHRSLRSFRAPPSRYRDKKLSGRPRLIDGYQHKRTVSEYFAWFAEQGIDHVASPQGRSGEYYMMPQTMPFPDRFSKDHWLCERAIDFVQERDRSKPFVMEVNFAKPHPPYPVPYPWDFLYRAPEMPYPIRPANFIRHRVMLQRGSKNQQPLSTWEQVGRRLQSSRNALPVKPTACLEAAPYPPMISIVLLNSENQAPSP